MDLDEASRRRVDFVGDEPIRLANEQTWYFPVVGVRRETWVGTSGPVLVPVWVVGQGRNSVATPDGTGAPEEKSFDDQLQAAHNGFIRGAEVGAAMPHQTVIDLGTVLLRRNYRVTVEEADWLLFEGFWQQARRDSRFIGWAAEVVTMILRVGLTEPLDQAERIKQSIPRHQGQTFEGFEAN